MYFTIALLLGFELGLLMAVVAISTTPALLLCTARPRTPIVPSPLLNVPAGVQVDVVPLNVHFWMPPPSVGAVAGARSSATYSVLASVNANE